MSFADILKTFKKPEERGGVIGKIDRYLISLDGKLLLDKPDDRAKDCFHPSELSTTECVRKLVYSWLKVVPSNPGKIEPRIKRVFDVGHHKGFILQQYFWDMGILEGKWECIKCDHQWWDVSPKQCPECGKKLFIWDNLKYLEVPIYNRKWNIKGHADGIIIVDGKRILIELKSIKNRDEKTPEDSIAFEDLSSAKLEHVHQANMYIDALDEETGGNETGVPFIERGIIIYFAKNNQLIKEFPIHKMDIMLAPSYNKINATNHALANGYLPERAGDKKSCGTCQYCPFKNLCWDNDYTFEQVDNRKAVTV